LDSQVINFHLHTFFCSSKIEFYFNILVYDTVKYDQTWNL
jgi:hypothetical protein